MTVQFEEQNEERHYIQREGNRSFFLNLLYKYHIVKNDGQAHVALISAACVCFALSAIIFVLVLKPEPPNRYLEAVDRMGRSADFIKPKTP
jgi:hypothetical protein